MDSDFLFAMPSTLSGVSRTLDLGGTFDSYNESANSLEADTKALFADWQAVGDSFVRAIEVFEEDEPEDAPRGSTCRRVDGAVATRRRSVHPHRSPNRKPSSNSRMRRPRAARSLRARLPVPPALRARFLLPRPWPTTTRCSRGVPSESWRWPNPKVHTVKNLKNGCARECGCRTARAALCVPSRLAGDRYRWGVDLLRQGCPGARRDPWNARDAGRGLRVRTIPASPRTQTQGGIARATPRARRECVLEPAGLSVSLSCRRPVSAHMAQRLQRHAARPAVARQK